MLELRSHYEEKAFVSINKITSKISLWRIGYIVQYQPLGWGTCDNEFMAISWDGWCPGKGWTLNNIGKLILTLLLPCYNSCHKECQSGSSAFGYVNTN